MTEQITPYGLGATVDLPYEEAVAATREELSKEGFAVLTEIDVRATLKAKLDVDFRPYVILGACSAPLAQLALTAERDVGLLLPCNVVVYAADEPGRSVVAALDAEAQLSLARNDATAPVARDAKARLRRVLDGVASRAAATR